MSVRSCSPKILEEFYAKIEVIVRITKGHCPPQEQTILSGLK